MSFVQTYNKSQAFTSSGTWTAPAGVTVATVLLVGGGGAGGSVAAAYPYVAGAGGGGGQVRTVTVPVTAGTGYTITIGAGGAPVTSGTYNGQTGGTTSFGTLAYALGGGGGTGQANNFYARGGEGGGSFAKYVQFETTGYYQGMYSPAWISTDLRGMGGGTFQGYIYYSGSPYGQYPGVYEDRKSTRLNSSHMSESRMPSSA